MADLKFDKETTALLITMISSPKEAKYGIASKMLRKQITAFRTCRRS